MPPQFIGDGPEAVAGEHRPGGGVPLPVRRGAAAHHRAPVDAHLEAGVLAAGDAVGDLDVDGEADAELARAASLAPPRLLGAQPGIVRGLEQPLERPGVVAGVVDRPHRGGVREGVAGHQVDAPASVKR